MREELLAPVGRPGGARRGDDAAASTPPGVRRAAPLEGAPRDHAGRGCRARPGARPSAVRRRARDWARPRWRASSRPSSTSRCASRADLRSSEPATSPRSSPISTTATCLFIDEIHRLPRAVEEVLYPAMEDFQLDIVIGKGPSARSIRLDLPRFTLVGATTRSGMITGPLRDRFGFVARLDYYDPDDLQTILVRSAQILGVPLSTEGAAEIGRRARGTPRIANRLLKRVRDYAEVRADGRVELDTARDALALFEVDELGLDKVDRARCCTRCAPRSGAIRSASARWRCPCPRSPTRSRTSTSRSC